MVQEYRTGDEPIPGYRLSKFLGRGGFGEVWQAVAPGRTEVALKIISLDRKQGMKEFRSLRLVKRIRHPNLVPILAFWLKDADGNVMDDDSAEVLGTSVTDSQWQGKSAYFNVARADQLVIAMGLGDKNLLALLEEYQASGGQGIPEEELLDYMEGCARAIDFLNSPRHDLGAGPVAIQHCDIKPQNIMIVGDAVQLCDFGLARSLTDVRSTSVAGSIAYGAPELFWENKPSEATDQYSLAISYYELRTGQLPFGPEMAHLEVMQAHRDGNLDFSYVGDAEREVLVRATAPVPSARFARTLDMVRALRRAVQRASQSLPAAPPTPQPARSDTSLLVTGREIVPGYKLLEHLFYPDAATDVWSATGADNKPLALWIYDLSRAGGLPDLASLRMAQAFSHPQFARLYDFWLQDAEGRPLPQTEVRDTNQLAACSRLIVAGELARTNLAHRLDECRQTLATGIPQPELLGYLRQLAAAVDAFNEARHVRPDSRRAALVHCDLRPANLLLLHNDVKIGNLAWARALESDAMQLPPGVRRSLRPFAGPELARDRLTRWSDQYSLAACYIVLRTASALGDMPSAAGIQLSASSTALDLSKLPQAEMAVLAKALHARPEQRFANCRELAAALEAASKASPAAGEKGSPATPAGRWSGTIVSPSPEAMTQDSALMLGEAEAQVPISETAPEHDARRSTLVEPFLGAAPGADARRQPRRGVKRTLAAAVVVAALAAAFVAGDDAQHDALELAAAGQYKQAIESLDSAGWWRCWRIDRPAMRRTIANNGVSAAEEAARAGNIAEACASFAELAALPDVMTNADVDGFRDTILPMALKRAGAALAAGEFRQAGEIQQSLAGVFKQNFEVVGLGKSILEQGSAAALEYAHLDDFKTATAIYSDLNALAPDDAQIDDLRAELIERGREEIERRQKPDEIAAALAIYRPLEQTYPKDHGVREIGEQLVAASIALVEKLLDEERMVEAKILYRELAPLRPEDSKIAELGRRVLAGELAPAGKLLADGNWSAALTAYERAAADWPDGEKSLAALKDKIVARARAEIEAQCEKGESLDEARQSVDRLAALLPGDRAIAALKDRVHKLGEGHAPAEGPEQIVVALLNQVDGDLETGLIDGAEQRLKRAETAAAELSGRKSLLRRLLLTRAHVAARQRRWDEAAKLLADLKAADFSGADLAQRGRFDALRALVLAKYDGQTLAADVELGELVQAIVAAPKDDPAWKSGKRFRIDADRLNKLAGQALLRAIDLAYDDQPDQRRLAGEALSALAADFVPAETAVIQARAAAAQTHLLLAAAESPPRDAVVASLAQWRDQAGEVGRKALAATAGDLSRWGANSAEPGALQAAIAALSDLRRHCDEAKTEYAGLVIELLAREAALAAPDWETLRKQCQAAEDAATVAGGHPRLGFVKACRAECALEAPTDSAQRADALMAEARGLPVQPGDRPYFDYVDAVVRVQDASTPETEDFRTAATQLATAFAQPAALLDVACRKTRASQTLLAAAAKIAGLADASNRDDLDPPEVAPKDADEAYLWLQLAGRLSPSPPAADAQLALAVAMLRKTEPDEAAAKRLAGELAAGGRQEAWLLIIAAREAEREQPAKAVAWYAQALAQLDLSAAAGASAEKIYAQTVAPGLALAARALPPTSAEAEARRAVAKLYAARGRLIRANSSLAGEGLSPDDETFKAFDNAIRYDAENAELYVERGYARWAKDPEDPKVLEPLEREDIQKAFALERGNPAPAALGLRGIVRLLQSRTQSGDEQVSTLKGAIEDYQSAIAASAGENEHYSEFLDGAASAYVELANFSHEGVEQFRVYLEKAVELARASSQIEYRPNPEFAWLNLGNAEEDMIWRVRDYGVDHYCRAIDAFQNAAAAALKSGRSPGLALYSEGRCRSKLVGAVLDGKISKEQTCGATVDEHIEAGLQSLGAAAEKLKNAARAESHLWRARLYVHRARTLAAAEARQAALADADQALKAALDAIDESDRSWAVYQLEYVNNAWDMKRFDEARTRALVLLDSSSPSATAEKKRNVVYFVASAYARAGDAKRGLQEYQTRLDAPEFRSHPAIEAELLVSRGAYILESGLWAQSKQLCETSARDAIKLAHEAEAPAVEAQAWIVLYEHLLRAHPTATAEQMKECSAALAHAVELGLPPATHRSRSILLAQINLQLADGKLPLAERLQFAEQGLKAIDKNAVSGASPQQTRVIEKLRADLEKVQAEIKRQLPKPAPAADVSDKK